MHKSREDDKLAVNEAVHVRAPEACVKRLQELPDYKGLELEINCRGSFRVPTLA